MFISVSGSPDDAKNAAAARGIRLRILKHIKSSIKEMEETEATAHYEDHSKVAAWFSEPADPPYAPGTCLQYTAYRGW